MQDWKDLLRPVIRRLPPLSRVYLRRYWHALALRGATDSGARRAREETDRFAQDEDVHDLPPIFHYWSNTYLRPRLESFGFSCPEEFFAQQIQQQTARGKPVRIISIGAGNCDTEVRVATLLRERGVDQFVIDCLDLTAAMLQRGESLVRANGLERHFRFVQGDFNRWQPDGHYDIVIANQSLHHVTNLEGLFDAIHAAIGDDGLFVTSDIIGRNGHQRWPEALAIVREFWNELPRAYRYNRQLLWHDPHFRDWDCSIEGFEGIRAQDILPLLHERFGFDFFYAYGNVIDPFIDRSFGPHFDPQNEWDRTFIDRVHARDEAEILAGTIKPTHMLAAMRTNPATTPVTWHHLTPESCLRVAN